MDKCQLVVIEGGRVNDRAAIEPAMLSALMRNDSDEFNRLQGILERSVRLSSLESDHIEEACGSVPQHKWPW